MSLSGRALTSGLCNIDEQHDRNHRQKQLETLFAKLASADPQTVAVLFVMEAFLCPTCSQALKISTTELHPTRDGVDVVTNRCLIQGDIWTNVVVNKVKAADTQIAALTP